MRSSLVFFSAIVSSVSFCLHCSFISVTYLLVAYSSSINFCYSSATFYSNYLFIIDRFLSLVFKMFRYFSVIEFFSTNTAFIFSLLSIICVSSSFPFTISFLNYSCASLWNMIISSIFSSLEPKSLF